MDQYGVDVFQQKLFTKTGLTNGSHTIKIECTGTKQAAATGTVTEIDYIEAITEPDNQAPTVPAGLLATAVSETRINLSWEASVDNVGVTGYRIERSLDGSSSWTQIGTSVITSYSDMTVSANTTYYYRVKAVDAANNTSDPSISVNATTPAPDTEAPTIPAGFTATAVSGGRIDISWTASTDNVGVTEYRIERSLDGSTGWTQVGSSTTTDYSDTTVSANTTYYYRVIAVDAANNISNPSATANATTPDVTLTKIESNSPSALYTGSGWLTSTSAGYSGGSSEYTSLAGNTVTISFTGTGVNWYGRKYPNRGIAKVYIDGVLQGTVDQYGVDVFQQKLFTKTGLTNGSHTIKIECTGTKQAAATGTVTEIDYIEAITEPDNQAPTAPTGLTATASAGKIDTNWTASTDNVGVAEYRIERSLDGSTGWTQVGTSTTTNYSDTTVSANTTYYYRVIAADVANNQSNFSATANATTPDVTLTKIESNSPSALYTGSGWLTSTSAGYSGGSSEYTSLAGNTVTISFTGTGVNWYGRKYPNRGIAKVYIDGVLQGTVDQYGADAFQQELFTKTGLTNGSHTIKIECTGTKQASATGTVTEIDYIEVIG